ncbi:fused DNA-binding transcriptional regulator; aminotransferase [Escherichia coli]|uniref:Fused DNA-binding transcriptional regulator aminotransferase n=1 Tax=Escherichia coli TaxID=562 RepID=A0A376L4S3_ECOLX|nr:fused DNA-binding transcriptional regulator; aminotransferase [Escherichia coli]
MTRYQHLATLLAERIEQGLYRHGEKIAVGAQLKSGARRQHQHRATGVSDAGNDEAHHSAAAFGLFCRTT